MISTLGEGNMEDAIIGIIGTLLGIILGWMGTRYRSRGVIYSYI